MKIAAPGLPVFPMMPFGPHGPRGFGPRGRGRHGPHGVGAHLLEFLFKDPLSSLFYFLKKKKSSLSQIIVWRPRKERRIAQF